MSGHVPIGTSSTTNRTKTAKSRDDASTNAGGSSTTTIRKCQGCNRDNHTREFCRLRHHPDFNKEGQWSGSAAERKVRVWDSSSEVLLPWKQKADGTPWDGPPEQTTRTSSSAPDRTVDAPTPPKKKDKAKDKDYYGSSCGNNDSDRRGNDGGRRGGSSRTDIVTHLSCNCGESDTNSTYRQCLVSLPASSIYFTALTLFDTGAYTSFVNREVAKCGRRGTKGHSVGRGLSVGTTFPYRLSV